MMIMILGSLLKVLGTIAVYLTIIIGYPGISEDAKAIIAAVLIVGFANMWESDYD